MWWVNGLVGLIIGIITGAMVMYFKIKSSQNKKNKYFNFQKNQSELKVFHKELYNHFSQNIQLLSNLEHDCQNLYRHIDKSIHDLRCYLENQSKRFNGQDEDNPINHEKISVNLPLDYPMSTSSTRVKR
ncbi:Inner membrane protein YhcB [Candidatus Erwinia haradaeae]|uniref:Z-ring associated protein G n=1 Tax=Candidatus Erwinia haradaeae TaxID=1922217 RepID=A0A451D1W2_9GAMM|nr:Inner membrane protein YhcB [Candidatus Erwinia haradaeae]